MEKLKKINLYEYYYFVVVLGYIMTLFIIPFRPGIFAAGLICLVLIAFFTKKYVSGDLSFKNDIKRIRTIDALVLIYFVYNILSVIWLMLNGMTISVFASEFISSVLPVIFYIFGRCSHEEAEAFYKKYLYAILILCIVSFLLYIIAPQFYADYLFRWSYISKADAQTTRVRMESVVGSTVFGAVTLMGTCISTHFIMKKDTMKQGIVFMVINFIFTFLANMRSSMVVAILVVVFLNHLLFFTFKTFKKKYFAMECGIIAVAFVLLFIVKSDLIMKVYYRLISLPGAIGQRSEQWIAAVNNMYSTWLGNGLGANGHHALDFEGAHVVADGGLIKQYCEIGIIGFSLFLYILIVLYNKALRNLQKTFAEVALISAMLMMSIGSNVLCFQLVCPLFWFVIGHLYDIIIKEKA